MFNRPSEQTIESAGISILYVSQCCGSFLEILDLDGLDREKKGSDDIDGKPDRSPCVRAHDAAFVPGGKKILLFCYAMSKRAA